ncbi:MAG: LuxR C-terminal-related transcriptional regulator [Steroidobacteraceae bacterium]|nr:LuxR C-terminal-related transcriptional regulator [Steroidobacteraceae bacterium]
MTRARPSPGLLEGKFRPQVGAREQVARIRLRPPPTLLDGPIRCVTVVAPTGYGKSTLMAQWYDALASGGPDPIPVTWLNLDDNDNDPNRLLRYLFGALGRCVPSLAAEGAVEISQTSNVSVVLESLSIALAAHGRPVVLFLDDAHVISNPAAVSIVDWLLSNAGTELRSVVGSRQAVGWATAELRVRGQLLEIDQRSLAFDVDEARQFCAARLSRALEGRALEQLVDKTEGWPAAMELLTLALNDAANPGRLVAEFATTERGILEYLADAVFGRLPAEQRHLAHQLAQFDRFCPELADAALAEGARPALFGELQRRHLFLIALEPQGRWYRFHHLVGDYLRRHDSRRQDEIAASLTAGGRWLFEHGMVDDAIDCAVRARDWDLACRWLVRAAEDSAQRQGYAANLLRWIRIIPGEVIDRYPLIRLSHVFSLVFIRSAPEFERELADLEALAGRLARDPGSDRRAVQELLCALPAQRMMWDGLRDHVAGLRAEAEDWLARWPRARLHYKGDVLNVAAFGCKSEGDLATAFDYCDRAEAAHAEDQGQFGVSWSRVLRALLLLKRGDFRAALAAADAGLRHVQSSLFGHPEHTAFLQAVRAGVLYDFDDVAGAALALEAHPDALDDRGIADFLLLTYLTRARLQFSAGRVDEGLAALQLGRRLGQRQNLPRVSVTLAGEECVWFCRLGRLTEALELARAQDFDRSIHPKYDVVADKAARIAPRLLMADRPEVAVAQLGPALVRATEKGFHHRRVELLILQAAALLRCGRTAEALQSWGVAIELGERFGYRRVFLDDMDIASTLNHAARGHDSVRVPGWLKAGTNRSSARNEDTLTRKERRILKFLETGASNREIADSLFVSEGTLKWHLHNVYRKLGCRNRSGAIAAARRLGALQ